MLRWLNSSKFFNCLYQRLFLKKFLNHNSYSNYYCWLLLNQLPQEYAMSTFFLDQHLLTASLPVQPILDARALDEESVFLQPKTHTVYVNCTFWTSLHLCLWGSIEQTIIFNPPHPTTLVATISNLEGLLFFEGQILMQKMLLQAVNGAGKGKGGGGAAKTQYFPQMWQMFQWWEDVMIVNNGNRTRWSPLLRVSNHISDYNREGGVQFVNHLYDYRQNWMTWSPVTN